MSEHLSPLERECVRVVAAAHWPDLSLDGLVVRSRENTGVGRFVGILDRNQQLLPDGVYEAAGRVVEMEGLPLGLDFALCVCDGHLDHLELVSPGAAWDGIDRPWRML